MVIIFLKYHMPGNVIGYTVCESLYFLCFMDHDIARHLVTVSIIPRVVDNMPVAWCTKNELDSTAKDICTTSFPVGCFIDKNGKTLSRCNPVQVSPPYCLTLTLHFNLIINDFSSIFYLNFMQYLNFSALYISLILVQWVKTVLNLIVYYIVDGVLDNNIK